MMLYLAAFDVAADKAFGTITLTTVGESNVVVTLTSLSANVADLSRTTTIFHHYTEGVGSWPGVDRLGTEKLGAKHSDSSFALVLQTALQAAATTATWTAPSGLTVAYSSTTNRYTIAYATANFTIAFSTAAGAALLGYTHTEKTGAQTYAGTLSPDYTIEPTQDSASLSRLNFELEDIATQSVGASGISFGLSRAVVPIARDWIQQYELPEKTYRLDAASSHPFTFQELFEWSRTSRTFIVYDGFGDENATVHTLRADGSAWSNSTIAYASEANIAHSHINFRTLVEAIYEEGGG